jgi:hypothetical protein
MTMNRLLLLPCLVVMGAAPVANLIGNADFELCWIVDPYWDWEGGSGQVWCVDPFGSPIPPAHGNGVAVQCYDVDNCHQRLFQAIDVGAYGEWDRLDLCFDWRVVTLQPGDLASDYCSVYVRSVAGDVLVFQADNTQAGEWARYCTKLTVRDVETVDLSLEADTDATGETWCAWDQIALVAPRRTYLPMVVR